MIRFAFIAIALSVAPAALAQGLEVGSSPELPGTHTYDVYSMVTAAGFSTQASSPSVSVLVPHASQAEIGGVYDEICVRPTSAGGVGQTMTVRVYGSDPLTQLPSDELVSGVVANEVAGLVCLDLTDPALTWTAASTLYQSVDGFYAPVLELFWVGVDRDVGNSFAVLQDTAARSLGSTDVLGTPIRALFVADTDLDSTLDPTDLSVYTGRVPVVGWHLIRD
ncbi:MAG: hypothetical protein E6Q89_00660 [Bacteroidia bacterium]|nr:MAG: hypothetical protein E6Q89_00660 [Bacteroidia bacterium]